MANPSNIAPLKASEIDPRAIEIRITHRGRDMLVRNGHAAKYLARFVREAGTSVMYALTVDEMNSLHAALEEMRPSAQRYDKVAIDALERQLEHALFVERTRDLAPEPKTEPGLLNLLCGQLASLTKTDACLRIGDRVIDSSGEMVTVDGAYGLYRVPSKRGRFYSPSGERVDFILGYGICTSGGESLAVKPCELSHIDGRRSYLQILDGGANE